MMIESLKLRPEVLFMAWLKHFLECQKACCAAKMHQSNIYRWICISPESRDYAYYNHPDSTFRTFRNFPSEFSFEKQANWTQETHVQTSQKCSQGHPKSEVKSAQICCRVHPPKFRHVKECSLAPKLLDKRDCTLYDTCTREGPQISLFYQFILPYHTCTSRPSNITLAPVHTTIWNLYQSSPSNITLVQVHTAIWNLYQRRTSNFRLKMNRDSCTNWTNLPWDLQAFIESSYGNFKWSLPPSCFVIQKWRKTRLNFRRGRVKRNFDGPCSALCHLKWKGDPRWSPLRSDMEWPSEMEWLIRM